MTAALKFISRKTNEMFESHMRRAAHRISAHEQRLPGHGR